MASLHKNEEQQETNEQTEKQMNISQETQEYKQQQKAEESKVKQVTFLETENKPKKVRKRMRNVMNQLRAQMEFYFGDANMCKDRFMKQRTESHPEGYVPLSVFLDFNKIKELTDNAEILSKALRSSELLQVSEDGTRVRRTTPVKRLTQAEIDSRTVYVEGFHKFISRDWIQSLFSRCGKVAYISLPRFKTTNEIKGFAFVEFENPEDAEKAVKKLNRAPDSVEEKPEDKVGSSVKQTKNLKHFKKRATNEGIDVDAIDASINEEAVDEKGAKEGMKSKSKKKKKKNRVNPVSEEEKASSIAHADNPAGDAASSAKECAMETASKPDTSGDADEAKVKKSKKSKKKRKRKSGGSQQASEETDSAVTKSAEVDSSAQKSSAAEDGQEGKNEIPNESGESDDANAIKKSENQTSRKRKLPGEESHHLHASKVAKIDPESHSEKTQEEKSENTSSDGNLPAMKTCEELAKDSVHPSESDVKESAAGEHLTQETESQSDNSRKRKTDPDDLSQEKVAKAKKQKEGKVPAQPRRSLEQASDTPSGEGRKRKRKSLEGIDDGNKKKKKPNPDSATEDATVEAETKGKKTRLRKHKRSEPQMRLRVMTKEEWARLKSDYLSQQKANMNKLKEQLKEASRKRREGKTKAQNGEDGHEKDDEKHPKQEFVADTVLEVKSVAGVCVQTIKADIAPSIQLAYIDFKPGMTEGHIRCKDGESASKLLKTGLRGCSLSLVQGDAEQEYWAKLRRDREAKWANTKRPKKRGKHKILQRAQNPQGETVQRQHLKFTDDDEENADRSQNPVQMEDDFNAYSYHPSADSENNVSESSMIGVDYEYDY